MTTRTRHHPLFTSLLLGLASAVFAAACGDSGTGGAGTTSSSSTGGNAAATGGGTASAMTGSASSGGGTSSSSGGAGGSVAPPPPTLGTQIDRVGRPLIDGLLNHSFIPAANPPPQQVWNQNGDPSTWSSFTPALAQSLAILDGFDGTCGDQMLAKPLVSGEVPPDRYDTVAALFAEDALWLSTVGSSEQAYLGVELDALNVVSNSDRGGRTLKMDVVQSTYSLLIDGQAGGFDDGVAADSDVDSTTFPYLAAPH